MSSNMLQNNTVDVPKRGIEIPKCFKPLVELKKRYKVYYGGRGAGKTINFGIILLLKAMTKSMRILCVREIQKSIKDSVHKNLQDIIENKRSKDLKNKNIWNYWTVTDRSIRYANGSEFIFTGLKNNANQIKSMANISICWCEEAHALSYASLKVLKPTIRGYADFEGTEKKQDIPEIWFSFNRETENDPVYEEFCVTSDDDTLVCQVNYYDNPFFPAVLDNDRLRDLKKVEDGKIEMDEYRHVWLGEPKSFMGSSYYGKWLRKAEEERRICKGVYSESLKVHTAWDIGIGDSTAIWFFQLYGLEIRIIDYYEDSGEGLPFYVDVIKEKGYRYGSHFAPHDMAIRDFSTGITRLATAHQLGLDFDVLPKDNVSEGIGLIRRNFHRCFFDSEKTTLGLKCLKNYRKEFDEIRQIYKEKPYHDWSSHGADAFRYLMMAIQYISADTGYYKSQSEFEDDYEDQYVNFVSGRGNKITGY